jgi:hypothetical protein
MEISKELEDAVASTKDFNALVQTYVLMRDRKEELKRERAEQDAPINDLMDKIEVKLLGLLKESGQDSAKTSSGTAYKSTQSRAKIADWNIFIDYIKKNDAWDLLTKAVAKDAVRARIEDTGEIVPGIDLYSFETVGIRRS